MDKKLLNDYTTRTARIQELLNHDLFFVCGAPKSGTTWFQRLLDTHPEIVCSGEGHFTEALLAPIGKVVQQYNKRQSISAERVYEGKPYYQGLRAYEMEYIARTIIGLIMSQRRIPAGTLCIGDKTPRYTLHLKLLARIFPAAKFIHIVRDGRDVITSTCHHAYRAGHRSVIDKTRPEYFSYTKQCANVWVRNVHTAEEFGRKNPDVYLRVKYEDMQENPQTTLATIFRYLGVNTDDAIINECISKNEFKLFSGGREKGEEDKNSYFRTGASGGWKNFLINSALKDIYAIAGNTLKSLGYPVPAGKTEPAQNADLENSSSQRT